MGKIIHNLFALLALFCLIPGSSWAFDQSSVTGTYNCYALQSIFSGADPNGGWGAIDEEYTINHEVTFDGNGNLTISKDEFRVDRRIDEVDSGPGLSNKFVTTQSSSSGVTGTGTYVVEPDGGIIMYVSSGVTAEGFMDRDAQRIVYGWRIYDDVLKIAGFGLGAGIRKGSGYSVANLNGTYFAGLIERAFDEDDVNGGWGSQDRLCSLKLNLTFDGTGIISGLTMEERKVKRDIGEISTAGPLWSNKFTTTYSQDVGTDTGTYTVSDDGEFLLSLAGGTTVPGQLGPNGECFVFGMSEYDGVENWAASGLGIGSKKGNELNTASLKGFFGTFDYESAFKDADINGGWGKKDDIFLRDADVYFNGRGNFEVIIDEYEVSRSIGESGVSLSNTFTTTAGQDLEIPDAGTYSVSSDGVVTMIFDSGVTAEGKMSLDGKTVVVGWGRYEPSNYQAGLGVIIGVKKAVQGRALPSLFLLLGDNP